MSRSKRHRGRCASPMSEPPEGGRPPSKASFAACAAPLHDSPSDILRHQLLAQAPHRSSIEFVRVLRGSSSKFRRREHGARLPELSNFCCLPGRAGGISLIIRLLSNNERWLLKYLSRRDTPTLVKKSAGQRAAAADSGNDGARHNATKPRRRRQQCGCRRRLPRAARGYRTCTRRRRCGLNSAHTRDDNGRQIADGAKSRNHGQRTFIRCSG
jgi:hypothetical protein